MSKKYFLVSIITIAFILLGTIFYMMKQFWNLSHGFENRSEKPQIIVSILPQKQIVEKIAGDGFKVTALIPPGFSPATYEPTTQDIKNVANADIYFRIGHISFEKTNLADLEGINSKMEVVDTSILNNLRKIEEHSHEGEEEHDDGDEHEDEAEIDPHVWLSPRMVKQQAEVIYNTLVETYPEKEAEFTDNYKNLVDNLEKLDQELQVSFTPIKGKTMLVYHPAFGYLARDYEFLQEHIEIEGKEPSVADLQDIISEAKADGIKIIFVQKQFSQDSAQAIAENIEGVVVQIDPLDPDYLGNMKKMANLVSEYLSI